MPIDTVFFYSHGMHVTTVSTNLFNKKMSLGYFLKQTVGQSYKTQMEDGSIIVARWQPEKKAFCTTSK